MNRRNYHFGLFGKNVLICDQTECYYYIHVDNEDIMLICNEEEKMMKLLIKRENDGDYVNSNDDQIEKNVKKVFKRESEP